MEAVKQEETLGDDDPLAVEYVGAEVVVGVEGGEALRIHQEPHHHLPPPWGRGPEGREQGGRGGQAGGDGVHVHHQAAGGIYPLNGHFVSRAPQRPRMSYAQMIAEAILLSDQKRLTLSEIYAAISQRHPYYFSPDAHFRRGWQNSIRHNLTLNRCFLRTPRAPGEGRGSYWTVDENAAVQKWFLGTQEGGGDHCNDDGSRRSRGGGGGGGGHLNHLPPPPQPLQVVPQGCSPPRQCHHPCPLLLHPQPQQQEQPLLQMHQVQLPQLPVPPHVLSSVLVVHQRPGCSSLVTTSAAAGDLGGLDPTP